MLSCPEGVQGNQGCTLSFEDPDFSLAARDTLYYVRAIEEASATINGDQLRCERDASGVCVAVQPCRATAPTDPADDCLAPVEERAWSSPIFVDYAATSSNQ